MCMCQVTHEQYKKRQQMLLFIKSVDRADICIVRVIRNKELCLQFGAIR